MGGVRSCGDVLVIPTAAQGHINPTIYFLKALMSRGRGRGLTTTMLLRRANQALLTPHLKGGDEGEGESGAVGIVERFRLELVADKQNDDPGKSLLEGHNDFGRVCGPFLERVLEEQRAGGEGPKCMIADQFHGWSESWAIKLQIPRYVLISSPATFAYCIYNHSTFIKRDRVLERVAEDPILDLPGIPTIRLSYMSRFAYTEPEFISSNGDSFGQAEGLIFSTVYELEASSIDAFDAQLKATFGEQRTKMLPVGPLLPPEFLSEVAFKGNEEEYSGSCIEWLDSRPPMSVLYIAFGSLAYLSETQIQELAKALESSGVSFLWVLRVRASQTPGDDGGKAEVESKLLPSGFQERTKERGLVYHLFAPQLRILSHPAIRGFMFHCGWNSSMESVCRGVPMIGWPLISEQKTCCRILEQAGVAVPIRPKFTDQYDLVMSDEVGKALQVMSVESEWKKLKKRTLEVQSIARAAVAPGGSSFQNIDKIIEAIQNRSSRIPQNQ